MTSVPPPAAPLPTHPERPDGAPGAPPPVDDGPGWSWWMAPAALGLGLVAPILVATVLVVVGLDPTGDDDGAAAIILTAAQDLAFIGAALYLARYAGRRLRPGDFGLRATPFWRAVGWAAAAAVTYVVFANVWNAVVAGSQKQEDIFTELGVHRSSSVAIALLALLICVLAPIAEEFLFRGFCFEALRPRLGVAGAALSVGVVFGAVHATSTPPALLVELAFLGFVLCLVRWRTRSLYPCIGIHAVNNAISYGVLVGWGWEIVPLTAGSLGLIALVLSPVQLRSGSDR